MKLNKILASFAAVAALGLVSCSEGQYWNEASNIGDVYLFAKPAQTLTVAADDAVPSVFNVTVTRTQAGAAQTVDVEFASENPELSGPASVTFEAGSITAVYPIRIDAEKIRAGLKYKATLSLAQPKDVLLHANAGNLEFTFNLSQILVLKWEKIGTAYTLSQWAGNEDLVAIPVEECKNDPSVPEGVHYLRLVSPYYYLEPDYAQEGYNIGFYLDEDWNALEMAEDWQYMGEYDDENGYFYFGCPEKYGAQFINQGNIYLMAGVVGTAEKLGGDVTPGWYENLQFQLVQE